MPNPSELQRVHEEGLPKDTFDELDYWKKQLRTGIHGKDTKEWLLSQLRAAANRRGILVPAYNTDDFVRFIQS